jgi:RNA polymerase sigma factor (sigma-70 family)
MAPAGAPSWLEVYEAHAAHLVQLATFLVGRDDASDLVADGVARAVASEAWDGVHDHRAYLTRVLINLASDERRRRTRREGRERRATLLQGSGVYIAGPSDVDVRTALSGLSPQQRAIVFLIYWEDLAIAEVARQLDVTEGTVRRQLARAKDRLRRALA